MESFNKPDEDNRYLHDHVALLLSSFYRLTGRRLTADSEVSRDTAKDIYYAPFVLVSHNTADDPVFNYANEAALDLFEMSWEEFTSMPSRHSAEPVNREERERLLKNVTEKGFIDDYSGVRISGTGKRFLIKNGIVWNVFDENGNYYGQAATFNEWVYL